MIDAILATQDETEMIAFRSRLKELMLQKSVELNKQITKSELSRQTGVPVTTIQRWYEGEFDQISAKALYPLLDFFKCDFNDLIERVETDEYSQ